MEQIQSCPKCEGEVITGTEENNTKLHIVCVSQNFGCGYDEVIDL